MTRTKKALITLALAAATVAGTSAVTLAGTPQDSGAAHTDNTHITSGDA